MYRRIRVAVAVIVVLLAAVVSGCSSDDPRPPQQPKIEPPAIREKGYLRAAIDLSYPPFGAKVKGQKVGLDVDVASALADQLGLKLRIIDTRAKDIPFAVRDRSADIGLGAVPVSVAVLESAAFAGSYIDDGPAFFSVEPSSATLSNLAVKGVAVQRGTVEYWSLRDELGEVSLRTYPTLREAFSAAASGTVPAVCCDAALGAYLTKDFPNMRYAGQYGAAQPLGVLVGKDSPELEAAVRGALDQLAIDGILATIRGKWVGSLPALEVEQPDSGN